MYFLEIGFSPHIFLSLQISKLPVHSLNLYVCEFDNLFSLWNSYNLPFSKQSNLFHFWKY